MSSTQQEQGMWAGSLASKTWPWGAGHFATLEVSACQMPRYVPSGAGGGGVRGFTLTGALLCSKIRGTQRFRSLEMHSKRSYKIGICSVIRARGAWGFSNYKGFTVIFPKSLDGIERFTKVRIFLIPHVHSIISPSYLWIRKFQVSFLLRSL